MRKFIIVCLFALCAGLGSCDVQTVQHEPVKYDNTMFVCVERGAWWQVVYHRETGVMYVVSAGTYNYGTFEMMCEADGKPLVWKGEQK